MNTKHILQVDYNQKQGLILGWKYTDLNPYLTFFRHIIVIFTEHKSKTHLFLSTYLKKIRPGDIYSVVYYNRKGQLKMRKWKQKIKDQTLDSLDFLKGNIQLGDKQMIMGKVQQQFDHFSDPIVVTIFLEKAQQKKWFQARIFKQRSNQKYDFIVGMFGPFAQAHLSFANQVNLFPFVSKQDCQAVHYYLSQLYQSAVLWAQVSIQCLNDSITSCLQNNWRNTNFNRIQRIYRGPSIQYQNDFLHFYGNKKKELKYNLFIKLTYVTLERRKFFSEKLFSVNSLSGLHNLTFSHADWRNCYHLFGDHWLPDDPFMSLTILKFEQQNTNQQ